MIQVDQNRIGLIILGAWEFPKSNNFTSHIAFKNSYERILQVFTDSEGLKLPTENILDLFDSDDSPDELDHQLREFIQLKRDSTKITDLLIYYVGHGGFDNNQGYVLAIKKTNDDNIAVSGISLKNLSTTIRKNAYSIRTYFIFDCCYSGEASKIFQSSPSEVLSRQFKHDFPSKGVALLCSSSKDLPSIIVNEREITMFTEGFETALRSGNSTLENQFLSLRQIRDLTYSAIEERNPGEAVRPEVHAPNQIEGDISEIPFFPNTGFKNKPYDIIDRSRRVQEKIINNDLQDAGKLLLDFVKDFDENNKFETEVILVAADCNALVEEKNTIERAEFKEEQRNLYKKILNIVHILTNTTKKTIGN